jgi:hypothetical protein
MTDQTPETEAGRTALKTLADFREWSADPNVKRVLGDAEQTIEGIEQEAGRLAVAEALSVERIAEGLWLADTTAPGQPWHGLPWPRVANPTRREYLARAAATRAYLLSPEQPEVTE